jgi:hypothetical protein
LKFIGQLWSWCSWLAPSAAHYLSLANSMDLLVMSGAFAAVIVFLLTGDGWMLLGAVVLAGIGSLV